MCVRSSIAFYGDFNLDMGRSPGFGSSCTDLCVLLTLAFTSAPHLKCLTLPVQETRRTVLQKVRRRSEKLRLFVNIRFQVLFHSPPGVLFTFPSQYFFAIGHQGIFRLGGWSLRLPSGFHVSRCTLDTTVGLQVSYTRLSLSLACFPKTILLPYLHHMM